jgi:hypothetical protein
VYMGFSCIYRTHELTKFTNKSKKIAHVLLILFHLCIKFDVQTHYSLAIPKKEKFLTDLWV